MNSISTVIVPASETRLTTVDRIKLELGIISGESDQLLGMKIDEATSDIQGHANRVFCQETISQQIWGACLGPCIALDRAPIVGVTSVTADGTVIDPSEYRIDASGGLLYRLGASGSMSEWSAGTSIEIVFVGGYLLPGQAGRDLPPALEAAAISLVQSYWMSRGRDPLVRQESIPGVRDVTYWVGAVGASGDLPPDVMSKIGPFRRPVM